MAWRTRTVSPIDSSSLAFGSYVPQLDTVRGIAVAMVLVAHLSSVRGLDWVPSTLGVGGVGIFFALSGFLITRGLLNGDGNLPNFYNRRAARILPAYLLMLGYLLFAAGPATELLWAATFSFNFLYFSGTREYFHIDPGGVSIPPVGHVWSLCVEEHFYWFWPPLLLLISVRAAGRVAAAVVVATPFIGYWIYGSLASRGYQPLEIAGLLQRITFTQLTAIGLGCLIAVHEGWFARQVACGKRHVPRLAVLAVLTLSVTLLAYNGFHAYCYVMRVTSTSFWQSVLGPTCLHFACAGAFGVGLCCGVLARLKTLRYVGRISYGVYLFHLPIYAAFGLAETDANASWWTGMGAVALTIIVAAVSYHWIEAPILSLVKRRQPSRESFTWRTAFGSIAAASLFAACVLSITTADRRPTAAIAGLTPEIPPELRHEKLEPRGTALNVYRWMGVEHTADANGFRRETPFPAKRPEQYRIAAIGDSYTWGMCVEVDRTYPAVIQRLLRERGLEVEVLNCGKVYGQAQDILLALENHVLPLEPDCVVYAATLSDSIPGGQSWRNHTLDEWRDPAVRERFCEAVAGMSQRCEAAGSLFRMFVFCQSPDDPQKRELVQWIEQLGNEADVQVITVERYLKLQAARNFEFNEWDPHPNRDCHRIHGQIVARHLEPIVRDAASRSRRATTQSDSASAQAVD